MHQINLSDELYQNVRQRAAAAGFASVDEYVADLLRDDVVEETPNLDHLFTPERLATIEAASAEVKAGKHFAPAEVDELLAKRREEWLRQHPNAG